MKKCQYCHQDFSPKNPKGKFCSDKCRVYSSRRKVGQDLMTFGVAITHTTEEEIVVIDPLSQEADNLLQIASLEEELKRIPDTTKGNGKRLADSLKKRIHKLKYPKP